MGGGGGEEVGGGVPPHRARARGGFDPMRARGAAAGGAAPGLGRARLTPAPAPAPPPCPPPPPPPPPPQVLHDAFFRHQTKPKLSALGDLYYEGKEFEAHIDNVRPGGPGGGGRGAGGGGRGAGGWRVMQALV